MPLRTFLLHCFRAIGGFALAQRLTRKRLRILCYHGFSIGDEYRFAPFMFMRGSTFERRLQILKKRGVAVISLDEAIRRFRQGQIRNAETVITLDDGWASNLTVGLPILKKFGYPACVYVTTEHLKGGTEAFNVVLNYMLCASRQDKLVLKDFHPELDGVYDLRQNRDATFLELVRRAERAFPLAERQLWLRPLATALGQNLDQVLRDRRFTFLTADEMKTMFQAGVDIQLHTHTHRLPSSSFEAMAWEIEENRKAIRALLGHEPRHFCYPSGVHEPQHVQWLEQLGVLSGTTCDNGHNDFKQPVLLLKRYLDHDDAPDIEFDAEVSGVRELARSIHAFLSRAGKIGPSARMRSEKSEGPAH